MKTASFHINKLGFPLLAFLAVTWLAALTVLVLQVSNVYTLFDSGYSFLYGIGFVALTQFYLRIVSKNK